MVYCLLWIKIKKKVFLYQITVMNCLQATPVNSVQKQDIRIYEVAFLNLLIIYILGKPSSI